MPRQTVLIIGAGPVGLEAAREFHCAGFRVVLVERGEIAENVRSWGHVSLFSPCPMNTSVATVDWLRQQDIQLECQSGQQTGTEFVDRYLLPLGQALRDVVDFRTQTSVIAISRGNLLKQKCIGKRDASHQPFRVLVESRGHEEILTADIVLDCSGTYPNANWIGTGGIPCPGERTLRDRIIKRIPTAAEFENRLQSRTVLVIGQGYSAATVVQQLSECFEAYPKTAVIWVTQTRREEGPITRIPEDALPARDELAVKANRLCQPNVVHVDWRPEWTVDRVDLNADRSLRVSLQSTVSESRSDIEVDEIVAAVGYRPDFRLYEELQIHECYASSGPMKLAAFLLGQQGGDCLAIPAAGVETLLNPEPGFFILGAKSYGRGSQFLMRNGYEQVHQVCQYLTKLHDS